MLNGSLGKSLLGHSACSAQPQRSRLSISAAFTLVLFKHIDVGGLFSILTVLIADFSFWGLGVVTSLWLHCKEVEDCWVIWNLWLNIHHRCVLTVTGRRCDWFLNKWLSCFVMSVLASVVGALRVRSELLGKGRRSYPLFFFFFFNLQHVSLYLQIFAVVCHKYLLLLNWEGLK